MVCESGSRTKGPVRDSRRASGVLIACPMRKEAEALQECIGNSVEVTATGVGVKRSVPFLLRVFRETRPSLLIFTGSASQLDLSLHMGDIVVPREWCFENGRCTACDAGLLKGVQSSGWPTVARGVSLDRPVLKATQRKRLFESTGGAVYDSVSAAVLRAAHTEGMSAIRWARALPPSGIDWIGTSLPWASTCADYWSWSDRLNGSGFRGPGTTCSWRVLGVFGDVALQLLSTLIIRFLFEKVPVLFGRFLGTSRRMVEGCHSQMSVGHVFRINLEHFLKVPTASDPFLSCR